MFQRMMNLILMDIVHSMVYLDDIIVFSQNGDQYLQDCVKSIPISKN